jgi:hypothetical protein
MEFCGGVFRHPACRVLRRRAPRTLLWGKMNAHQIVCHLIDSFGLTMGAKAASEDITFLNRNADPMGWASHSLALAEERANEPGNGSTGRWYPPYRIRA